MKKLHLLSILAFGPAALALVACDGNNGDTDTSKSDTTSTNDSTATTTNGDSSSTTTTTDTSVSPDVTVTPGTVKSAQVEAETVTCDPASIVDVNPQESLTDVVVTAPKFDASPSAQPGTFDGYYVADQDGGAYSGITLRVPVALAAALVPGDVVDLTGQLKEAFCLTEIDVSTITKKTPVTAPTPITVAAADLANEAYESMLVKVEGVTISASTVTGVYESDPGDFQVSYGFPGFFLQLEAGKKYNLTGVLRYAFSKWQLVPRSLADVEPEGGTPTSTIADIQGNADSTGCTANSIQNFATYAVNGTLQTGKFTVTAKLDGYYLTDGSTDDYSGVLLNVDTTAATNFAAGDTVAITAQQVEFYCLTELKVLTITKTGSGGALPAAKAVAKTVTEADLEKYEGMLVDVSDVTVTGDDTHGAATTDGVFYIDNGIMGAGFTLPAKDTHYTHVIGIVRYSFSKYRVQPRTAADLVTQ
ncbi:MAG: hypothetical protein U1F43_14135 [Myxococcota bacterium]